MIDEWVNINLTNIKDVVSLDPQCLLLDDAPIYFGRSFLRSKLYFKRYSYKTKIHEYSWLKRWTNDFGIRLASIWKKSHPEGDSFVLEIDEELDEEDAKPCIDKLKKLSLTFPEDPEVRYTLASFIHYDSVFPYLAIEEYRKVLKANPKNLRARYRLALLLKDLLRLEEALEEFNEILKIDPDFEGARYYSQVISDIISHRGQDLIIAALKGSRDVSIYFDLIYMMRALHLFYLAELFYLKLDDLLNNSAELRNTIRNTKESKLVKKLRSRIKSTKVAGLDKYDMINYIMAEMFLEQLNVDRAYSCFSRIVNYKIMEKVGFIFMNEVHRHRAKKIFQEILKEKEDDEFSKKALRILEAVDEVEKKASEVVSSLTKVIKDGGYDEDDSYPRLRSLPSSSFSEKRAYKTFEQTSRDKLKQEIERYLEKIKAGLADAETYCELGEVYLKLGESKKAIDAFEDALNLKPDLPRALFGLARAKFRGGFSGGEEIVLKLLEVDPKNVKNYLEAIASDREYPGDEVLLKAFEIDPEHASDYVKMFSFEGRFVGGGKVLMKAMELDDEYIMEYLKLCSENRYYPGDDVLLKAIELNPFQEINFIKLFNFDGKFPGDREILERALARGHKDVELFYLHAKTFDAVNSEAGWIYEKKSGDYVLVLGLPYPLNILELGIEKVRMDYRSGYFGLIVPNPLKDIEARAEYLKKVVTYDPNFFDAWVTLARDLFDLMWYKGLDNQDEVIRAWREVLRLNPDFAEAHRYLAEIYWYTLRFDDALREFEEMERLRPEDTFNTLLYGNFLQYLGKFEEAEKKYEKLKDLASYYRAYLYHYLGRYDEAEVEYFKALKYKCFEWLNYKDIELLLALLMFQLERYDDILILFSVRLMSKGRWDLRPEYAFFISKLMEKVKCYEVAEVMLYEVEKKDPEYLRWSDSLTNFKIKPYDFMKLHPRILSVLGGIEFTTSKPAFQEKLNFVEILDEALKYLERIKRNSNDVLAHYGLALLCEKVGNFEGAEKELKEVLKIKPDFTQAQEKLEYLEKRRSGGIEKKMN